jgi:hypothetical protein
MMCRQMNSPEATWDVNDLAAGGLTVLGALVIAGAVIAALFAHKGRQRAAVLACALPLALVLATAAVSLGGFSLIRTFSGMAVTGSGGESAVLRECARLWTLVRMASGAVALLSLLFLVLGLVPFGRPNDAVPVVSPRRSMLLFVLPLCALVLVATLVGQLRSALRVTAAVVTTPGNDRERMAARDVLRSEGIENEGSGGIAEISSLIAIRAIVAGLGGFVVLVVLLGLALTGLLLAAPVRVGMPFVVTASFAWLAVAAAATALALGALAPSP